MAKRKRATNDFFIDLAKQANAKASPADLEKISNKLKDCTILVFGVPDKVHKKSFLKTVSRFGRVNLVQYPLKALECLKDNKDFDGNYVTMVVYSRRESVSKAIRKLKFNKSTYEGRLVNVRCYTRVFPELL